MSAPPPKITVPLGPFALINPMALAIKAGAATSVALGLDYLTACPDVVSSTFVAVLCTSPTVMMGLRSGIAQLMGSVLGGLLGTLMMIFAVPAFPGIPLAVTLSIGACFLVRYPQGYPVAAFSALFVQAVPRGGPGETFGIRMLAVAIAAVSGFVVNLVVSGRSYQKIFLQRLHRIEEHADMLLIEAPEAGPRSVHRGFGLLAQMATELRATAEELRWRKDAEGLAWIEKISGRVEDIHHLLHLIYDLGLLLERHDIDRTEVAEFLVWARCGEGDRPSVPAPLDGCADRIAELWAALRSRVEE